MMVLQCQEAPFLFRPWNSCNAALSSVPTVLYGECLSPNRTVLDWTFQANRMTPIDKTLADYLEFTSRTYVAL